MVVIDNEQKGGPTYHNTVCLVYDCLPATLLPLVYIRNRCVNYQLTYDITFKFKKFIKTL